MNPKCVIYFYFCLYMTECFLIIVWYFFSGKSLMRIMICGPIAKALLSKRNFYKCDCQFKVNSVQEACAKCFAVHLSKFEILQTTWKNKTKNIKMLVFIDEKLKLRVWCSLLHFFHLICKISNLNTWTAKRLMQASCTELTLPQSKFHQN